MSAAFDNTSAQRFERVEDGKLVFADYRLNGTILVITHVEADPALRGKGAAGRLMQGVLEEVRQRGLKVSPLCSYAASYIERNPAYRDLLSV